VAFGLASNWLVDRTKSPQDVPYDDVGLPPLLGTVVVTLVGTVVVVVEVLVLKAEVDAGAVVGIVLFFVPCPLSTPMIRIIRNINMVISGTMALPRFADPAALACAKVVPPPTELPGEGEAGTFTPVLRA
jgi:hypothetical protein